MSPARSRVVGLAVALVTLAAVAGCGVGSGPSASVGSGSEGPPSGGPPSRPADPALVRQARLAPCPDQAQVAADGSLPDVTLPCLGGPGTVDLSRLRGPALVNLWWSGCRPCRDEAPLLQSLAAKARGRLTLLGVDVEDPNAGLRFAIRYRLRYPMVSDPHENVKDAGLLPGFPVTYFVDRDGRRVGSHPGGYASADRLRDDVRRYLGVDVP